MNFSARAEAVQNAREDLVFVAKVARLWLPHEVHARALSSHQNDFHFVVKSGKELSFEAKLSEKPCIS